ncbi:HXXEE domain-containing protein [Streptomyces sp. NPDC005251]|uniref:HXXEE domain-containing protein n=1 Tax=unclassified Streptomyces TaxID=2593676 RepID=UPI0033AFA84C
MARFSWEGYRRQWPRVGGVLAMAVGGATALAAGRMRKPQALSAANFGALLIHQYEEYQDPGWFPGQFNHGVFKSDTPRNYPLNTNTGMCINTGLAYPYYIAPIVFPTVRWLGLSPVLFGMAQALGHGIIFPRLAGDKYSPGFLASLLLHVPIGTAYIRAVNAERPLTKAEWAAAVACTVAFAASSVGAPNFLMRDKDSPHAFTAAQMGHHDVPHTV